MASFVLIHGSWHGGWCFDRLAEILRAGGHEVIAPDLPGMGGDEATLRAVTLAGWAEFAADLCRKATQRPVVLAGHSRGGIVVSEAAELAPEVIDALVYITAIMLPAGMSREELRALWAPNTALNDIVSPVFGGAGNVVDGTHGAAVFAQLSPPEAVAAAMARLVAEPRAPSQTPLTITPERFGSLPRTYIECSEDRTILPETQARMQEMVPGAKRVTLHADHSPFLSAPEELAAALIAAIPQDNNQN